MKQLICLFFTLVLASTGFSQHHPDVYKKLDSVTARPGDPFADLPAIAKQYAASVGRIFNHTQLDSVKYWIWYDTLGAWSLESQTNYSYSTNSQILLRLNENLENQVMETWQFDDNGNVLEFIYQVWDGSAWVNSFRFTYLYDGDNLLEFIYQSFAGGSYANVLRYEYTYDGNGDLVEQLTQNWVAGEWIASSRRTITNNDNHQQVLVLQEQWQSEWVNEYRETYTYGSSDELLTSQVESWESDWEIAEQTTYAYDGQLQLIEQAVQVFEGGILTWATRDFYTYDSQGNLASITSQTNEGGELADRTRQLLTYDDENNQTSYVYQYWDDVWVSNDSAFFYWNPVTSISDASTMEYDLILFPNPASHEIQFEVADHNGSALTYSILSIDGMQQLAGKAAAQNSIDVSGLTYGMHVMRITSSDGKHYLSRFIKQ